MQLQNDPARRIFYLLPKVSVTLIADCQVTAGVFCGLLVSWCGGLQPGGQVAGGMLTRHGSDMPACVQLATFVYIHTFNMPCHDGLHEIHMCSCHQMATAWGVLEGTDTRRQSYASLMEDLAPCIHCQSFARLRAEGHLAGERLVTCRQRQQACTAACPVLPSSFDTALSCPLCTCRESVAIHWQRC